MDEKSIKNLQRNWISSKLSLSTLQVTVSISPPSYFTFWFLVCMANFDIFFLSCFYVSMSWCCPCLRLLLHKIHYFIHWRLSNFAFFSYSLFFSFLFFSIFDPVTRSSSWSQFERRHSVKKSTLSLPHCHPTFLFTLSAELSTKIAFMCDQLTLRVGCEFAYNSSHTFGACSCST